MDLHRNRCIGCGTLGSYLDWKIDYEPTDEVDETDYKIQINAQCFVLKSRLTCQVIPMDDSSCKLVRIQRYCFDERNASYTERQRV